MVICTHTSLFVHCNSRFHRIAERVREFHLGEQTINQTNKQTNKQRMSHQSYPFAAPQYEASSTELVPTSPSSAAVCPRSSWQLQPRIFSLCFADVSRCCFEVDASGWSRQTCTSTHDDDCKEAVSARDILYV